MADIKVGSEWVGQGHASTHTVEVIATRSFNNGYQEVKEVCYFSEKGGMDVLRTPDFLETYEPKPVMEIGAVYDGTQLGWQGFIPTFLNADGSVLGRYPVGVDIYDTARILASDVAEYEKRS